MEDERIWNICGQALMMMDDGAYFEGEMKSAGVLNGRGSLVLAGGDRLEGSMHGVWSEGIKVTGVFHKGACPPPPATARRDKPKSFGKFATHPNQKWKAIFRQCYAVMGVAWESPQSQRPTAAVAATGDQSQRAWEGVAAALGSAHAHRHHEKLQTIPDFGRGEQLDAEGYRMVVAYLGQAFDSSHHPLGIALAELSRAYKNTYGTLAMQEHAHLLLQHAVLELHSLIERLYQAVRCLFPALPAPGTELVISESEVASMATVLHPEILPRVCSCLFDLYTHDNEHENEAFRKRLLELNQYSDETLMSFLDIDRKLWTNKNGEFHEQPFSLAIVTLQHLKTTFIPLEKFMVLRETFERMKEMPQRIWRSHCPIEVREMQHKVLDMTVHLLMIRQNGPTAFTILDDNDKLSYQMPQRIWRSHCPIEVREMQHKVLDMTVHLLMIRQNGPTAFTILDDNDKLSYQVYLGDPHKCSCKYFQRINELCSHICWVLLKKMQLDPKDPLSFQLGMLPREITDCLQPQFIARPKPKRIDFRKFLNKDERKLPFVKRRALRSGDTCPVCLEAFEEDDKQHNITYCRHGCGNCIHVRCMELIAKHQLESHNECLQIICPLCRGDFGTMSELRSSKFNTAPIRRNNVEKKVVTHSGYTCCSCDTTPVIGNLYRCLQCTQVTFCHTCVNSDSSTAVYHEAHGFAIKTTIKNRTTYILENRLDRK
ncbi:uncharacterized protein LOC111057944 [Nilaparvata lugens]|uniref:uncharacterized protein LOC111057944 n=1 Tax=Nilaparvata lugens TaxID=108931 RepID=UPI00193CCDD2|nr:uncharacterized protein LOC111057944 [Nilaparvata lugens]